MGRRQIQMMKKLFYQSECQDGVHTCIVEDNGRVAYAYLLREKQIVGDLWLYNQEATPQEPEWKNRSKLPFLNPAAFFELSRMSEPLCSVDEIEIVWGGGDDGISTSLQLHLRGQFYGELIVGSKPGWTIAASQDGPLAKRLSSNP
jgi:hypothetical protein